MAGPLYSSKVDASFGAVAIIIREDSAQRDFQRGVALSHTNTNLIQSAWCLGNHGRVARSADLADDLMAIGADRASAIAINHGEGQSITDLPEI